MAILGHAHPAVTRAIAEQAGRLMHVSNLFHVPVQARMGERLSAATTGGKVFFCNSGTEANEAAIKLARRLDGHGGGDGTRSSRSRTVPRPHRWGLTATASRSTTRASSRCSRASTTPLRRPRRGRKAIDGPRPARSWSNRSRAKAGSTCPRPGTSKAREPLRPERLLLMLDEVQTGMGRTGEWFASPAWTSSPDVVTLAKALAGGVAMGGVIARAEVAELAPARTPHLRRQSGRCAAALAAMDVLNTTASRGRDPQGGAAHGRAAKSPPVVDVREGGMIGLKLAVDGVRDEADRRSASTRASS